MSGKGKEQVVAVVEKKKKKPSEKYVNLTRRDGSRVSNKSSEGAAVRMAIKQSAYFQSIIDPFTCPGAKVPDDTTAPSFTYQTITKILVQTGASTSGTTTNGGGVIYRVGSTIGTTTVSKYVTLAPALTGNGVYVCTGQTWAPATQIAAVAMLARPVSCGITLSFQGATNTDQGRILVGFLPPNDPTGWSGGLGGANVQISSLTTGTYVVDIACAKRYGRGIWLPLDAFARIYLACATTTLQRPLAAANNQLEQYGALVITVDGVVSPGSPIVEVVIAENWELIPLNNMSNIVQPAPSPSDPLEMACASNAISRNPTIATAQVPRETAVGTPMVGPTGGAVTKTDHPSFLDKIMSTVEGGISVGRKLAPMATALAAML